MKSQDVVARVLLESGPITASALARKLGLTPAAVRRHLDALLATGHVQARDRAPYGPTPPRRRGRPAKVYTLTAAGRDAFEQAYDDVALGALRYLADADGAQAVLDFARKRLTETESRYSGQLEGLNEPGQRATSLAGILTADGYAAGVEPAGEASVQICQHHCPLAHVAEEFGQFCEAETEMFSRLVGAHVTRLATLAHGDGVCTANVPVQPHSRRSERTPA